MPASWGYWTPIEISMKTQQETQSYNTKTCEHQSRICKVPEETVLNRNRDSGSEIHSVMSNSLRSCGLYSSWNSPGQNTGVGSLSFLQGIFPTHKLKWGLLHCSWILYQLSYHKTYSKKMKNFKMMMVDFHAITKKTNLPRLDWGNIWSFIHPKYTWIHLTGVAFCF